ncbi:D-2-hydroxyacid dehydrogenase [Paenibacillus periandrae]|uniref:D-2-hydroxyacid dehydrogenase n=1 Tax=Paenibacillus periandrae TaxID=1761741 RepID=UPI001F092E9A|nr:D-2-hydroxyacid dehydrogenase [Paenibacillus periandrae]
MQEIKLVLTTVGYQNKHWARFCEIFAPAEVIRLPNDDTDGINAALQYADVAVLERELDDRYLKAPSLRWVHCDHAGLNNCAWPEIFDRGLLVTGSAGRSAPALAEHALFFMLALAYRAPDFIDAQRAHHWGISGQDQLRGLFGQTIGIIGMGHIGKELAVRTKSMGMRVLGYRRSAESPSLGVDRLYCGENGETMDEILAESDFIVLALPLTNKTHHLIGKRELDLMKPTACLINMARGAVINESALVETLYAGHLGGVGLDTFSQEPLPKESPLWDAPRTLITPHTTPQVPDRTGRSLDIISENARRFREGKPLLNQLKPEDIYTPDILKG